jgi:hypothetical protein
VNDYDLILEIKSFSKIKLTDIKKQTEEEEDITP